MIKQTITSHIPEMLDYDFNFGRFPEKYVIFITKFTIFKIPENREFSEFPCREFALKISGESRDSGFPISGLPTLVTMIYYV